MFKRLLFGNEDKLRFKTSATDGIARLYSQANIPPSDARYWQSYVQLFDSASDVFTLLSVADVRRALTRHPDNIVTLVRVLIVHLESLQDDPAFSPIPNASENGAAISTGSSLGRLSSQASSSAFNLVNDGARKAAAFGTLLGGGLTGSEQSSPSAGTQRDRGREALNCCRILTRILPIVMEGDHDSTCSVQNDGNQQQGASLESDDFESGLLWSLGRDYSDEKYRLFDSISSPESNQAVVGDTSENQFVIEEEDEDEDGDEGPGRPEVGQRVSNQETQQRSEISLGERLTRCVVNLLFYAGFTVPWTDEALHESATSVAGSRISYIIWEKGIGNSSEVKGKTRAHESNRLEVMRLLLTLLSKSMFVSPSAQQSSDNHALRIITRDLEKKTVLPLLCSLLNVSVGQSRDSNWLGSLTSIPVGIVNDKLSGATEDVRQTTVTVALQILNVALAYEGPTQTEEEHVPGTNGMMTPSLNAYSVPGTPKAPRPVLSAALSSLSLASIRSTGSKIGQQNLFRFYISKLHRQSDFQLLSDGVLAVLGQRPSAATLLNSTTSAQGTDTSAAGPHVPEMMLLLWRLFWHNVKFRTYALDEHAPQLLSNLLFHALNNKDSAARQGLVRLAIFILHDISCDRAFAVNICKAGSGAKARITGGQRWGVAVGGGAGNNAVSTGKAASGQSSQASTGADILIQAVYALIATTKSALSALYAPLVITLTNVSPYFKNLSIFSANRLLSLFSSFSNASFLLAEEGNPRVLFYLIETLNSIVQHGFQRNANVIYAIVRSHRSIERLANFTLRRGIADVRRIRKRSGVMSPSITSPRSESAPTSPPINSTPAQTFEMVDPSEQEKTTEGIDGEDQQRVQTSASDPAPAPTAEPLPASEKARGKMRRSSTSDDVRARDGSLRNTLNAQEDEEDDLVNGFNEQELFIAASMVGREGFVPTQNWVTSWHKGLPLDVLQIAVVELVPKVQDLSAQIGSKPDADERILAWLREQNLESVLPPVVSGNGPQPRSFKWTPQVSIWLLSYIWGLIYVTSTLPYGLFNGTNARLFQLRLQEGSGSNATSARPSMAMTRTPTGGADANATAADGANGALRSTPSLGSLASTSIMQRTGSAAPVASPRLSEASASIIGMGNSVLGGISSAFGLGLQQSPSSQVPQRQDRISNEATI
jgi:hypothetical protein